QLTVAELRQISLQGSYKSGINIPELGVTEVFNEDLPTCVLVPGDVSPLRLPNDIITAATWNEELAYRRGKALAESSLWGGGNAAARVPGWYAPAVNIHRSPFGGRVGEYLSEDGLLAGRQSAQIVIGAQEKGMFCYVKHFAINSQETNRCGLMTWADEQTMREVYFKPFEICVKEG
ncbi:MAG: beta-glucosidase, partial [Clostridiales bacterium]|nr:beta-glucosidase [Clostridiales bacterium]